MARSSSRLRRFATRRSSCPPSPSGSARRRRRRRRSPRASASKRTHVLLDNLEQLLPDAAAAARGAASRPRPSLRLLVTSREPLRIAGETELDLPPLDEADAVALFLERARAVRADLGRHAGRASSCADRLDRSAARPRARRGANEAPRPRSSSSSGSASGSTSSAGRATPTSGTRRSARRSRGPTTSSTRASRHALRAARRLPRRLHARARGGGLRCGHRHAWRPSSTRASLRRAATPTARSASGCSRRSASSRASSSRPRAMPRSLTSDTQRRCSGSRAPPRSPRTTTRRPSSRRTRRARRSPSGARLGPATLHPLLALELAIALENLWTAHAPQEGTRRFEALLGEAENDPPELRARALRAYGGALDMCGRREDAERLHEESLALYRMLGDRRGIASLHAIAWR